MAIEYNLITSMDIEEWDKYDQSTRHERLILERHERNLFNESVETFLADGWKLAGGVAVDPTKSFPFLYQAVWRDTGD